MNGSWAPISGVLETPKRNRRKFVHEFTKFWLNLYVRVNLLVLVNYCSSPVFYDHFCLLLHRDRDEREHIKGKNK